MAPITSDCGATRSLSINGPNLLGFVCGPNNRRMGNATRRITHEAEDPNVRALIVNHVRPAAHTAVFTAMFTAVFTAVDHYLWNPCPRLCLQLLKRARLCLQLRGICYSAFHRLFTAFPPPFNAFHHRPSPRLCCSLTATRPDGPHRAFSLRVIRHCLCLVCSHCSLG